MYKWTTHPQDDNKFHAWILKARHSKGWLRYTTTKTRYFVKRKTAKAWCLKYYLKAQEHHKEVLARQEKRKADLEALKPQLTPKQKSLKRMEEKIWHFEKLSKKTQTKIKAHTTRLNNYQKKVKYYQRKLLATVSS
jgi:peptidoglycan hydrolase CwlO-like protein